MYEWIKQATHDLLNKDYADFPMREQWVGREVQRPDGSRRTIHSLVFPIQTDRGLLLGSITRDITERRRAETTLQRHDAIMEAIGAIAEMFLQTANIKENIVAMLERLGNAAKVSRVYIFENEVGDDGSLLMSQRYEWVAPGTLTQIGNPDLQHLPYKAGGFSRWLNTLCQGQPICGEVQTFPPEERSILETQEIRSIAVVPIFVGQRWWGFIGFDDCEQCHTWSAPEVSILRAAATILGAAIQQQRAQDAIQESEQKFRSFFEQSTDSLVLVSGQGIILEWNQGARHLWGIEREEAVGQYIWDVQFRFAAEGRRTPESYRQVREAILDILRNGQVPFPNRWQGQDVRLLDGSCRSVHSLVFPIRTDKEMLLGSISRDVSELKRTEEELRKSREEAETAARTKSEFLANMSHEIRTPMNAVIGMTSLLLDTILTPEQRDYVQTIRMSGETLLTLINDILDFSKIEAGKLDLEQHPFNLRECVEEAFELLFTKAAEKGLDVAYTIAPTLPVDFVGDITRVRQILVNLLSNAIKFTEKGEVVVAVGGKPVSGTADTPSLADSRLPPTPPEHPGASTESQPQYEIAISVRDTGIGIPADRVNRLFQSFSQADTSMTRKYGGTGLGLVISERLAQMMGGSIYVESTEGSGSTFHITLKLGVAPPQQYPYMEADHPHLKNHRVLVVDDNNTNREILAHQLAYWGMVVRATPSPSEALDWILQEEEDPFDLAILDMNMPEMDGLTLAEKIRTRYDARALPLILWTSLMSRHDVERSAAVEIAATLSKPVRPAVLYDMLVGFFERKPREIILPTYWGDIDRQMGEKQPLRILLAEDNAVNQKVALRLLEKLGYRADIASNGLEVINAMDRLPYDLILMDVQMPEMDGVEATRYIRSHWENKKRPRIVAMTAHALEGTREWLIKEGMDDYVSKPVRIEEMIAALQRVQTDALLEAEHKAEHNLTDPEIAEGGEQSGRSPPARPEPEDRAFQAAPPDSPPPDSPSSTASSPVDETTLENFLEMMGTPALGQEIIALYLRDTPTLLANLRLALDNNDTTLFARSAHSLKSSSAQLGALSLSEKAREMEMMGRTGNLAGGEQLLIRAEAVYEKVRAVLAARLGEA
jgi:PAS domain S-box-containing protein